MFWDLSDSFSGLNEILGVDSFSILSNHRSFREPDPFSLGVRRLSRKTGMPGTNEMEGTPRETNPPRALRGNSLRPGRWMKTSLRPWLDAAQTSNGVSLGFFVVLVAGVLHLFEGRSI